MQSWSESYPSPISHKTAQWNWFFANIAKMWPQYFPSSFSISYVFYEKNGTEKSNNMFVCLYVTWKSRISNSTSNSIAIVIQDIENIFALLFEYFQNICLFLKLVLQVRSFNRCTQSQTICLLLQESNHWETHLDRLFLKQQEFKDTTNIASLVC